MYEVELQDLCRAVRSGTPINDGPWATQSTLMSIMGRDAAYTGQTLTWEDLMKSEQVLGPSNLEWGPLPEVVVPVPGRTRFA